MKTVTKLAVLLSLAAFAPFASAKSPEQAYLETCRKDPGVPVPVAVVSPSVGAGYVGLAVEIEFTVDTKGIPTELKVTSAADATLAGAIVDAVKQWRFTPAQVNGSAIATKVVLPIKIVDDSLSGSRYALK